MKILYNWLKEFVDLTAPPEELRARLSMAGIGIDAIEDSHAGPLLDADLTTNRPDCLGHYGIAREVAALYRLRLKRVAPQRSEEHTSELQSLAYLVCRLLLEKKKNIVSQATSAAQRLSCLRRSALYTQSTSRAS